MIEKEIIYSNPIKVDENNIQLDKSSKVVLSVASLVADKKLYELKLAEINKMLDVSQGLL
ncbi:hypothetical protein ES708_07780 [subsurface metagenome]